MNQQQQNHFLRIDSNRNNYVCVGWSLKMMNLIDQIFTRYPAVDKTQNVLSSHRDFLTNPMYHHGETIKSINIL